MNLAGLHEPFASRRSVTVARGGMVATSQPLATQAGTQVLQAGGNAIDAAIAAAAALTVVEPTGCGIGGDAFAMVWSQEAQSGQGRLFGLNASGRSPALLTPEEVRRRGFDAMPRLGWLPVTVPGIPGAWQALSTRFGSRDLGSLLAPAIRLARDGFAVTPIIASLWQQDAAQLEREFRHPEMAHWFEHFLIDGRPPQAGEIVQRPDVGQTLERLAESGISDFYEGRLADALVGHSMASGGLLRIEDLAGFEVDWVEPIGVRYRGIDVWELPPNGIGCVALAALKIFEDTIPFRAGDPESVHHQIESLKLAYADGLHHVTDPGHMKTAVRALLAPDYLQGRRARIGPLALQPEAGRPASGETVYLATADAEGNMVSYIQSNFQGFGSGVVIPGTGIALQNRGFSFSLDPDHPNVAAPRKRSRHTIIPGFLTRAGQPLGPFGTMGGFMQPQGHLQVLQHLIDGGLNPQQALDAPRWQWTGERKVLFEADFPASTVRELARRGHDVRIHSDSRIFGRGQIILRDPESGVLFGGAEPRADSALGVAF